MSCKTILLAAAAVSLFATGASAATSLPSGRWYKVDNYDCRAFRDYVDHKPSVIGTQRSVSQKSCAVLCNGTPNCAAYNYLVRIDRSRGRPEMVQECQLLNSVNKPVSVLDTKPGESAFVCYKGLPDQPEPPDFDADQRRTFQDGTRQYTPPPPPRPRND